MNGLNKLNGSAKEVLCLACGLCCNGVLFADVKLRAGDDAARLQMLGLSPDPAAKRSLLQSQPTTRARHFPQPCPAFDGCRCRIYADRPQYCRAFECLLLQDVKAGRVQPEAALRKIRQARRRAAAVERLLSDLGDTDGQTALSTRFRRTGKRLERIGPDPASADLYGRLTLALHNLNLLLSETFYPQPA